MLSLPLCELDAFPRYTSATWGQCNVMYGIPLPVPVNNVLPLIAVIKEMPLELYASFIVVKLTLLSRKPLRTYMYVGLYMVVFCTLQ